MLLEDELRRMDGTVDVSSIEDNLDYIYEVLTEIKNELSISNDLARKRMQIDEFRFSMLDEFRDIVPDILKIDAAYGLEWFMDDRKYTTLLTSLTDKDEIASCQRIRRAVKKVV